MENDDEVKGRGNSLDFGARFYDSRVARWFSLDPLKHLFVSESPFVAMGNNPIIYIDEDGKQKTIYSRFLKDIFSAWEIGWYNIWKDPFGSYASALKNSGDRTRLKTLGSIMSFTDAEDAFIIAQLIYQGSFNLVGKDNVNSKIYGLDGNEYSFTEATGGLALSIFLPMGVTKAVNVAGRWSTKIYRAMTKVDNVIFSEKALYAVNNIENAVVDTRLANHMNNNYNAMINADCADNAKELLKKNKSGTIFKIEPATSAPMIGGIRKGKNKYWYQHYFYFKDGYVYDPFFSKEPIEFDQYLKKYSDLNPDGGTIKMSPVENVDEVR